MNKCITLADLQTHFDKKCCLIEAAVAFRDADYNSDLSDQLASELVAMYQTLKELSPQITQWKEQLEEMKVCLNFLQPSN